MKRRIELTIPGLVLALGLVFLFTGCSDNNLETAEIERREIIQQREDYLDDLEELAIRVEREGETAGEAIDRELEDWETRYDEFRANAVARYEELDSEFENVVSDVDRELDETWNELDRRWQELNDRIANRNGDIEIDSVSGTQPNRQL